MARKKNTNPFDRWETVLMRLTICCLAALVAGQALLGVSGTRRYLSRVDRLEGEPISWQTPLVAAAPFPLSLGAPVINPLAVLRESRSLTIRSVRPAADPAIVVTVNGAPVGDLGRGETTIAVFDGDYIEIDISGIAVPCRFVLAVPGGGLTSPADGTVVEGQGRQLPVGKVKFSPRSGGGKWFRGNE